MSVKTDERECVVYQLELTESLDRNSKSVFETVQILVLRLQLI